MCSTYKFLSYQKQNDGINDDYYPKHGSIVTFPTEAQQEGIFGATPLQKQRKQSQATSECKLL